MREGRGHIQGPPTCPRAPPRPQTAPWCGPHKPELPHHPHECRVPPGAGGVQPPPHSPQPPQRPQSPRRALAAPPTPWQSAPRPDSQLSTSTPSPRPRHSAPCPATHPDTALLCSPSPERESSPSPQGTPRRGIPPSPLPSQETSSIPPHLRPAHPGVPGPLPAPRAFPPPPLPASRPPGASPLPWGQAAAAGHPGSCSRSRRGGLARPPAPSPRPLPSPRTLPRRLGASFHPPIPAPDPGLNGNLAMRCAGSGSLCHSGCRPRSLRVAVKAPHLTSRRVVLWRVVWRGVVCAQGAHRPNPTGSKLTVRVYVKSFYAEKKGENPIGMKAAGAMFFSEVGHGGNRALTSSPAKPWVGRGFGPHPGFSLCSSPGISQVK